MALNVAREPLVELLVRVKHGGHDEVEQSPQLRGGGVVGGETEDKNTDTSTCMYVHAAQVNVHGCSYSVTLSTQYTCRH